MLSTSARANLRRLMRTWRCSAVEATERAIANAVGAPVPGTRPGCAALVVVVETATGHRWVRVGEVTEVEPGLWSISLRAGGTAADLLLRADLGPELLAGAEVPRLRAVIKDALPEV